MKEKLLEFVKDKDKVSLKDIYGALPDVKTYMIRSNLNLLVNSNKIKRLERGFYSHI